MPGLPGSAGGWGAARAHIGELGKRTMLRRLRRRRRGELKVFRHAAGLPGFVDTLARGPGELKTYCTAPGGPGPRFLHPSGGRGGLPPDKPDDLPVV